LQACSRLEAILISAVICGHSCGSYTINLARNMDLVEMQRDLLTGAMDIYLSSVANRTNQS